MKFRLSFFAYSLSTLFTFVQSLVGYNGFVKQLSKKHTRRYTYFMILSGFGALWLTLAWKKSVIDGYPALNHGLFDTLNVYYYYLFNSLTLICIGMMLKFKKLIFSSILSFILFSSVFISLFIIQNGNTLFSSTVNDGMFWGFIEGGIILVPAFIGAVVIGLCYAALFLSKKINYTF